jgi:uncharacterized SAM-binding protein YcdF (DUF218 family)
MNSETDFLYSLLLKLLYPTSLIALLLLAAALFRKRPKISRGFFWTAFVTLMVCGNGWVVSSLTKNLEWRYSLPEPTPNADAILVLSGGLLDRVPPRPMIEVDGEGNRVIYAAVLFKQHKAPVIICTGGIATGGSAPRPAAEMMAEYVAMLGVPKEVVVTECGSSNTHEHAQNLPAIFEQRNVKRILLVTSAMHMPRALGLFRKQFPKLEFTPAPTDYHAVEERGNTPSYHMVAAFIPTPSHLLAFSEIMHEYLGIAYYSMKGWM